MSNFDIVWKNVHQEEGGFQNSPKDLVLSINLFTILNALLQKHNLNRTSTIAKSRRKYP
jgi:hypothetical protein